MNKTKPNIEKDTLFTKLGGKKSLQLIIDQLYTQASNDALLKPYLELLKDSAQQFDVEQYLTYLLGGRKTFSGNQLSQVKDILLQNDFEEAHIMAISEHTEDILKKLKIKKQFRDEMMTILVTIKNDLLPKNNIKTMALGKNLKEDNLIPKNESNGKKTTEASNLDVDLLQVMEGSVLCIVMINKKGTIQFFNGSAEKLWGYDRSEVIGKNVKVLTPPTIRKEHDSYLENYNETGKKNVMGSSREVKALTKDGQEVDIFLSLSESTSNGETVYVSFIQDITEKKKLQQEVQKQLEETKAQEEEMSRVQKRTEGILEQANDSVVTIGADKKIRFYNAAAEKMFGYTREEVMGQNVKMIVPMEHRGNHDQYVDSNMNTGVNKVVGKSRDLEMSRKDGSKFWGNLSLSKVDVGGELQYTAFIKDITIQRNDTMQAQQVQAAIDTGFASIEFEPDGTIITANRNFVKILGYSDVNELEGKHHRVFCEASFTNSTAYQSFWSDLASGKVNSGEHKRITKQGDEIWINATYTPVKDNEGKVIKVIKIANDISSVKFPVMHVSEIIKGISQGNLTQKFDMHAEGYVKEMGDALNIAVDNLSDILSTIDTSAVEVSSSADGMMQRAQAMKNNTAEVASAIAQMSKGAQDQAQRTDESSKLAEQVLASSNDMESKSDVINKAAEKGVKSCEEGLKIIKNLVENMSGINESAGLTSESIKVLTERAEEIGRTLNVITDIAAQTNLLALNAAIEAARAGEAGRGFAVVAEEIRKLAEDSRKSAVDIEKIIGDVQKDTQSASKAIDTMTVSVKEGSGATKSAESIFEEIAESSEETLQMSKSIKEASGAQKGSIDTVVKNIEQIVVVAEETAAGTEEIATSSTSLDSGMEEVAAASDQLTKIALDLKAKVSKFKLN